MEPRGPGNIGASARAIKNMGFKNLELVKPGEFLSDEARGMACNAADVLEKAKVYQNLEDAIWDKSLIIGTSRRVGRRRGLILPIKNGAARIKAVARKNRVAILFGREDKGLTNKEVEKCGLLITIPADISFPSLNIAQGVMLVAYELSHNTFKAESPTLVRQGELEALYMHIRSTVKLLDYMPAGSRDPGVKIMRNLKHLIGRAGLTEWELQMLHGICSRIQKKIEA